MRALWLLYACEFVRARRGPNTVNVRNAIYLDTQCISAITNVYLHTHFHTRAHTHTHAHTHVHARPHTRAHARMHAYTRAHARTHARARDHQLTYSSRRYCYFLCHSVCFIYVVLYYARWQRQLHNGDLPHHTTFVTFASTVTQTHVEISTYVANDWATCMKWKWCWNKVALPCFYEQRALFRCVNVGRSSDGYRKRIVGTYIGLIMCFANSV